MSFPLITRLPHLVALSLALGLGSLSASAQDAPSNAAAESTSVVAVSAPSPESLATAARNILELVEAHEFRMRRIGSAIDYFASVKQQDKVRQFSLMREREQHQYQQALETYRRLLGEPAFARVAGLLRNHFQNADERSARAAASDSEPTDARARAEEEAQTAAERAERVRSLMAAQAAEARARREEQAAFERSQVIARMRASQRAQLAQRLAQARNEQLEQRAAAARRYQPMPEPPSQRRADPASGGFGPFGRGGLNPGRGRGPWQLPSRR